MTRHTLTDFELYQYLQTMRPYLEFRLVPDKVNGGRIEGRRITPLSTDILKGWFFVAYRDDAELEAVKYYAVHRSREAHP